MKYRKFQTVHVKTTFFTLKLLGIVFCKNPILMLFLYQYLFNHDKILNINYPNTRIFVRARYWHPFIWVLSVRMSTKGPQKCQYQPKYGSVSMDLPLKSGYHQTWCTFLTHAGSKDKLLEGIQHGSKTILVS